MNKPSGYTSWTDRYSQSFTYDGLGNILKKTSSETRVPSASVRPLNYELDYEYDEQRPHLATKIGELYYSYDANGNVTRESTLPEGQSSAHEAPNLSSIGDVRRADQAFGFINEVESGCGNEYIRSFSWDAENRLKSVLSSNGKSVKYLYDADGKRTTKYAGDGSYTEGLSGETLYFNEWWTETADSGSFRRAKHIYVGKERIVTRLSNPSTGGTPYEDVNTYYYHPDHLGSAHCITDPQGNPYERIEYTPYGEMWIEIQEDEATASYNYIPFRFTGKEMDRETGLYYYGARYLDPKTSRWMSGDPAGYQLMNPMDGEGKPRQGYSMVEATNWYSYVSNNPVKYVDPTGEVAWVPFVLISAFALMLKSDTAPPPDPVNFSDLYLGLQGMHYNDGSNKGGLTIQSNGLRRVKNNSLILSSNIFVAIGTGLPRGMPGENSYSDGVDTNLSTIIDAAGLLGDILENSRSEDGHVAGDIRMNVKKVNGRVTDWNIQMTMLIPVTDKVEDFILPKDDAMMFLLDNRKSLENSGVLQDVSKIIGD
ncbi:hypothetical protein B4O97_18965 [Marispirochaeta aestuarii]|uniref:Teneurin-like YD-shell domain-containing protein n=1 Tax=Marispirochaeta aestuarii TaxID=1963862 RepID=A0A1Y1RSS1_9SPIO|nr:RHS repeat-associated core domain-containing protein [Marispirochaeta aestuarii]ORC28822.1 hypothetical protein B4O97_18965 [Marispirochaeta aestuarii]